jgi:hypothetical protein
MTAGPILTPLYDQDTFAGGTRAGANGWSPASSGSNWNVIVSGGATIAVASNEGTLTNSATNNTYYLGSSTLLNGEALVRVANQSSNTGEVRIILRANATGNTYYFGRLAGTSLSLQRNAAGTLTNLSGSSTVTATAGHFYWYRFRLVGASLFLKQWDDTGSEPAAWTLTAIDTAPTTTLLTAGRFGVCFIPNNIAHTWNIDHFSVTAVPQIVKMGNRHHSIGRVYDPALA